MKLSEQIRQIEAQQKILESDCMKLIGERDYWEEKATRLAESIGEAVGFDVGEHSSANCPVERADEAVWIAAENKKKAEAFDFLSKQRWFERENFESGVDSRLTLLGKFGDDSFMGKDLSRMHKKG